MPLPTLTPPPLEHDIAPKGLTTQPWARWFQLLWEALRGNVSAMYYQPAGQSIPDAAYTIVDFSTADIENADVTTGASWKFTASRGGVYHVSAGVTLLLPSPGIGTCLISLHKNGAEHQRLARLSLAPDNTCLTGSTLLSLAEGDYIDIRAFQNSGFAHVLEGGRQNWIAIHRLVG